MASGNSLRASNPYRGLHIGYPGSGKTGALSSLLDAGYKIRVLDFEGNFDPLVNYASPDKLANLDVITFQDRLMLDENKGYMEPVGIPRAFTSAVNAMKEWRYKDGETEVTLGKSSEWGLDTIVVVDSLTSLSKCVLRRAQKMNNKNPGNMTSAVWGAAVSDVANFIGKLKDESNKFHLIVNCHKQMIGAQDFIGQGDADEVKQAKLDMIKDEMIPTRYFPVSVTKASSQTIHGELPIMLEFRKESKAGKDMRIIDTQGNSLIDVKIPCKGLKREYPIETGLADIFAAMGYKPPT